MAALVLTREDVESLLSMSECIDVIDQAQREFSAGNVVMPVRLTTSVPERRNHLAMPALLPGMTAFPIAGGCLAPAWIHVAPHITW